MTLSTFLQPTFLCTEVLQKLLVKSFDNWNKVSFMRRKDLRYEIRSEEAEKEAAKKRVRRSEEKQTKGQKRQH